ncbi:MAG: hypothetical protein ACW98K_10430 [Candidatus Kariarchaeaceae archaeon]
MSTRKFCDELLSILDTMEFGLRAPLENITEDHLNHVFASHKMTIGQIAIHCTAWAEYFMADDNNKPWKVQQWTCRPCTYPLTFEFVDDTINRGFAAIRDKLLSIDDAGLEIIDGEKGPGYIIYRLQQHILAHSNQMAYLRQLLDSNWDFGTHFGDMASALIKLSYSTSRDHAIPGF